MDLDIFDEEAFQVESLTAAIQKTKHVPGRIGELGLFENDGITSTHLSIEMEDQKLHLVPAADRGSPGIEVDKDPREKVPFETLHLPQNSTIMADELHGVRAFGDKTETQALQEYIQKRQAKHRRANDATIEHHRMGAIKGKILDANGKRVLLDLHKRFGIKPTIFSLELANEQTKAREKIMELLDKVEDQLQGMSFTRVRVFCGRNYFKMLTGRDDVVKAFEKYQDGAKNRDDVRGGFEFCDVIFEQYRGQVGGIKFVGDDEAYAVPEGVPDLFIGRFAPANYTETVGTMGLPYYSKIERMRMNKGIELESQSNPIMLCTDPRAPVKLTG